MTLATIKQSLNEKGKVKRETGKSYRWDFNLGSCDSRANSLLLSPPSTSRKLLSSMVYLNMRVACMTSCRRNSSI